MKSGRSAEPAALPVDLDRASCRRGPSPRRNRATSVDSPAGIVDVRLEDRVVVERVVVDDQPVVLDEERDARVLACRWRRAPRRRRRIAVTSCRQVERSARRSPPTPGPAAATSAGGTRSAGRAGCGEWSRNRAPNSSIMRSSSGSTPCRSASSHHSSTSSASLLGLAARRGRGTPTSRSRGGTAPTTRCRSRRPAGACTPPSTPPATSARLPVISKYWSVLVARRAGVGEDRGERVAGDRQLLDAPVDVRRGRRRRGRRSSGAMSVTLTNWSRRPARRRRRCRSGAVHDQRHVDAALVGVLLVPLERRVAALRPAPRVVGVAVRAADVVDALDRLVRRLDDAVEELHLVHHAERARPPARRRCRPARSRSCCRAGRGRGARRRAGRSGRRCGRGTRRTPPGAGTPAAAGSRAGRPTPRRRGCAARARCRPGRTPSSSWRANQRSRATSHPSSKRPRYFSR